jgi:hypothetical protein
MDRRFALLPGIILAIALLGFPARATSSPSPAVLAAPLGTAFTYQGQLKLNGQPVTGTCDIQFSLYDAASGGSQVGSTQSQSGVAVSNGLFTTLLDFGAGAFTGAAVYLQVAASCPSGSSAVTFPRQPVTPSPYAIFAEGAAGFTGSLSGDVTGTQGTTSVAQVGGVPAANVASGATAANGATSANTPNTIVKRDGSGNFAAGTITANNVQSPAGQALELQMNGQRGLRLEPTTGCGVATCSPNVIGGFSGNAVAAGVFGAVIAGGGNSSSASFGDGPNQVTGSYGAVVGGTANTASNLGTVLGGQHNAASGVNSIAAGEGSTASGQDSIAMGNNANATGDRGVALNSGTASGVGAIAIGSGAQATNDDAVALGPAGISSGLASTVIGPSTASGNFGIAIGLQNRASGQFSVALGKNADTSQRQGAIVISDASQPFSATCSPTPSTPQSACAQANNEVRIRGSGGIRLRTSVEASDVAGANGNTGCDLPPGSGTFSCSSSRELKTDFGPIDPRAILEALNALPIQSWRFKGEDAALRHIGPVAEDFAAAFPLGQDDQSIATSDEQGVALAAIQALSQIVREQDAAVTRSEEEKDAIIGAQAARIVSLEEQVAALGAEQATREQALEARLAALEQAGRE